MDAIFRVGAHHARWCDLPERFGPWGTVARYFRRLSHNGLWQKLLREVVTLAPSHPLRLIEHFICRAARKAYRILGLRLIALARQLGLQAALPGPPWMLPHPDLSEFLFGPGWGVRRVQRSAEGGHLSHGGLLAGLVPRSLAVIRELKWWHTFVAGKRRVPGIVQRMWF
jgi:transposase